ncbi:hypothetical protein KFU94_04560 [Chloroflexi bacterium TSY]|nr:hypothetical protein [Chloroflexi bacterium TSY]
MENVEKREYNPTTNEWRLGTSMPTKRSGHNGIVANGCLHIMGGEGKGPGNVNGLYPQHEVYNAIRSAQHLL